MSGAVETIVVSLPGGFIDEEAELTLHKFLNDHGRYLILVEKLPVGRQERGPAHGADRSTTSSRSRTSSLLWDGSCRM